MATLLFYFILQIMLGQLNAQGEQKLLNVILSENKSESKKARKHLEHMLEFLVASVVSKYANPSVSVNQLFKAGRDGMQKGIDKYIETWEDKKTKSFKLSTYITWWIKQEIELSLSD